jgi:predicted nucleotidyltransferase component of viral defense system
LSVEPSQTELLEVQEYFGLPSIALVEKDYYVVKALRALSGVDLNPLSIVFGGGTSLSRAHRLIRRMSEDIDLKIISQDPPSRGQLRRLRDVVTEALLAAGFVFDPQNPAHRRSANESRYTVFKLPYPSLARGEGALRPEIQIELAPWPLRQSSVDLPVSSFVAEAFQRPPEVERIACVTVTQTAAEKFVALTRRVAAQLTKPDEQQDPTLVRHLYDLYAIREHYDLGDVFTLVQQVIPHDAEAFGGQSPTYRADPFGQTRMAVSALARRQEYAQQYADFMRDMVYGDRPSFAQAIAAVENILARFG